MAWSRALLLSEKAQETEGQDKGVHGITGAEPVGQGGVFDERNAFAEDREQSDKDKT